MATLKEVKKELAELAKNAKSKAEIKSTVKKMKADGKIVDYGTFGDGINVYDKNGLVIFTFGW